MQRLVVVCLLMLFSGCVSESEQEPTSPSDETIEAARQKGEAAGRKLLKSLMKELKGALESGSTVDAIEVCSNKAEDIRARVAEETGVRIRRTTLKVRNPKNAPEAWERKVLVRWAEDEMAKTHFEATKSDGAWELRYMKPIVTKPLCLKCHGPKDDLEEDVVRVLKEKYPDDQAKGYGPGELRGAVSVRVPISK